MAPWSSSSAAIASTSRVGRRVERGETAVIARFDVGSGLDQRRGRSRLVRKRRFDQWRLANLVAAVHITALGNKLLDLSTSPVRAAS